MMIAAIIGAFMISLIVLILSQTFDMTNQELIVFQKIKMS